MELVYETNNKAEALAIKSRLEEKGIPASLAGEHVHDLHWKHIPKVLGVWIYINEQLPDAKRLIENPNHQVVHPVNVEEFYRLTNDPKNKEAMSRILVRQLMWALGALLAVAAVYVIYKVQT